MQAFLPLIALPDDRMSTIDDRYPKQLPACIAKSPARSRFAFVLHQVQTMLPSAFRISARAGAKNCRDTIAENIAICAMLIPNPPSSRCTAGLFGFLLLIPCGI